MIDMRRVEPLDVPRELRSWIEYPEQPKGELDQLLAYAAELLDACVPFLGIGETPAACIARTEYLSRNLQRQWIR